MKFYDCATAPSPRRVRIFLAEKGITVPKVQVDLRNNEQLTPAFRAINPDATVPVLELDNGTRITDAIGICVYFEATHPQPPLMGESAEEKAVVTAWQRISERNGFYAVMDALRNSTAGPQVAGAARARRLRADSGTGRTRASAHRAFLRADGCAAGAERVHRGCALQHCRYHHAGVGRLRALGQAAGSRALRASAPLA
jgi:glutathione S-transferase